MGFLINTLFSLWWIPLIVFWACGYAWLTKNNNLEGGKWFWIIILYGAVFQLWPFISRHSKDIVFDGFLYDVLLFMSYTGFLLFFGYGQKFSAIQWMGVLLIIVGFVMMKMEFKIL